MWQENWRSIGRTRGTSIGRKEGALEREDGSEECCYEQNKQPLSPTEAQREAALLFVSLRSFVRHLVLIHLSVRS